MNVYLYLQIASALRVSILRGDYITEQQMPSIRALAQREGIVQKALKVLEKQGLIVSRGSKGYFVIESDQKIIELRNQDSNTLTKMLLEKLYELGFSDTEIIKMFEEYVATKNK
ncbi:GntR family transcriptional regulator [Peptoniphilus genitalis]|uniref:GntR family transcriptional regulator n=1 Tax=Peptoniphilus genitalis TaxID=3036303 RepID=UPI0024AC9F7F|nr:GntR family transcriptional regulator [Peptoniphilus sp. Marseille-Q7072]